MARAELARGYIFGEERDSPLDGRIVVLEGNEDATRLTRLLETLGADAGTAGEARDTRNVLLVSSDDEETLQAIRAFVLLLQGRLEDRRATEMERLIEVAMPVLSVRPHPAILDQARRNADFRADFFERYDVLDAGQVHDLYGSKAENTAALAGRWRNAGKIFGVEQRGRILYPAFQFDETGRPKPVVAAVLQALGKRGPWQVASWFTAPNGRLPDDRRPVEVIDTDPDAVADAARETARPNLF